MNTPYTLDSIECPKIARFFESFTKACEAYHRDPKTIKILGVTKGCSIASWDKAQKLSLYGIGESRLQALLSKIADFNPKPLPRIEFIGPIQSNKLKKIADVSHRIQSITQIKHLKALNEWANQHPERAPYPLLLEINTALDTAKTGASPDFAADLYDYALNHCPYLKIEGLMTMAGLGQDPEWAFAGLKKLQFDLQTTFGKSLPELSMGMSGDFPLAIKQGSTLLRIGSALFSSITE